MLGLLHRGQRAFFSGGLGGGGGAATVGGAAGGAEAVDAVEEVVDVEPTGLRGTFDANPAHPLRCMAPHFGQGLDGGRAALLGIRTGPSR